MTATPQTFSEPLTPHFGFYYTVTSTVYSGRTAFQKVEVFDTAEFGRVLVLDDITQVVEKNEYLYHEPMVHPALCSHPDPQRVLVIGGGDGGILREVLKHPGVARADMAELDGEVVELARHHLPAVSRGAFDDPRARLHITDGRRYVERHTDCFDVVIMDMTDPLGPSTMLYTREFFTAVKRALRGPQGCFVMHAESPVARPAAFTCIHRTLTAVFDHVGLTFIYVQMYATLWSVAVASPATDIAAVPARRIDARLAAAGITDLQVYCGATHHAMQARYPFVQRLLDQPAPLITDADPRFPDAEDHEG